MKLIILSAFSVLTFCGISQVKERLPVEKSPMRSVKGLYHSATKSGCSNLIEVRTGDKTTRMQAVNMPKAFAKDGSSIVFDYKSLDDMANTKCGEAKKVEIYNVRRVRSQKERKQELLNKKISTRKVE